MKAQHMYARLLSMSIAFVLMNQNAFSADEISLIHARSTVMTKYGLSWQSTRFDAKVKNLAYDKKVILEYRLPDGQWRQSDLSYNRPAGGGSEIWSGAIGSYGPAEPPRLPGALQFRVKYQVNGNEYVDDNHHQYFHLAANAGDMLTSATVLVPDHAQMVDQFWGGQYHGSVVVKNLGYAKDIQVHYTTDRWQTQRIAYPQYLPYFTYGYSTVANPNSEGVEVWPFSLDAGGSSELEYAVRYSVNGQTYWDNNFGQNYRVVTRRN
ncbi:carbohydrate-binding protein [Chitinivorax sp. B]|uniref:carbohydrate-binding protein n=1 Tax=Chitinivorax sp. B TaxID=2502235 RepID=UPI0010F472C3|nr:carbohydrate-binding protein [Chitinivorax sp. B]